MANRKDVPRWIFLPVLAALLQGSVQFGHASAQPTAGPPPTLLFVTQSDACDCVASLCVAGEQEVLNFLADNPWGFKRQTVDLKETPKATKDLGIIALPVVFLVDAAGQRVARFDGFFAADDFSRAWEKHLKGETR